MNKILRKLTYSVLVVCAALLIFSVFLRFIGNSNQDNKPSDKPGGTVVLPDEPDEPEDSDVPVEPEEEWETYFYVETATDHFSAPYGSIVKTYDGSKTYYEVLPSADYDNYIHLNNNVYTWPFYEFCFYPGWDFAYKSFSLEMDITAVEGIPDFYIFPFLYDGDIYVPDYYKQLQIRIQNRTLYLSQGGSYESNYLDNFIDLDSTINVKYVFTQMNDEGIYYVDLFFNDVNILDMGIIWLEGDVHFTRVDLSRSTCLGDVRIYCRYNSNYDRNGLIVENFKISFIRKDN